jgi:trehalose 6-phosphate synthase/phosphatase
MLYIAANRLPVTVVKEGTGYRFAESPGGVATGLRTWAEGQGEVRWVGWPGLVPRSKREVRALREQLLARGIHPVFMSRAEVDAFYGGFCNKTIWPLFHYFTMHASYQRADWEAYRRLNQVYADLLLAHVKPGDGIMVNDYHLMLLPRLVKEAVPDITTYFFLHIPFPTFEIFRLLPSTWRLELLRGVIAADVVGFHTSDYTAYFLQCVQRLLGYDVRAEGKVFRASAGRQDSKVGTFPLGIDFERFDALARRPDLVEKAAEIKKSAKTTTIIISVDRLDYTKGHAQQGLVAPLQQDGGVVVHRGHRRTSRTMPCGMTSWPSPARSNSWHGWATPSHGGCKGASPGVRRRRCGGRWARAHQRLR